MSRHATTILLFFVAVGLGIWLWLGRDRVTAAEKQLRENDVFDAWRRDELSRIEIAHEGETIVLERDAKADGSWRMTSPRQERADHAAVERLTTTLEFAPVVRKSDTTTGLSAPRAQGSVTMGGLVTHFVLGAPSPRPEGSSYFSVDGSAPFVVSKELTDALLASSDVYRDRTVVPYLSLDLQRFELVAPAAGFTLERADERSFKVKDVLASRSAVDKVWGALAEIRAEAFPKDADADALTAHPRLRILMTPKEAGKPPAELVVGDACPGHPDDLVVLRRQPSRVAACVPKGAADALVAVTPDFLVDRRPFSFRPDEIEELRLEWLGRPSAEPQAIELARRGKGFHEREPVDRELPPEEADAASELLGRIDLAAADEVTHGGSHDRIVPVARARVRSGEHEETVDIGPLETKTVLRRVRDDARLVVSRAVARRLVPRKTSLRSQKMLEEIRRPTRIILRCGTPQELVDKGAGFKLVDPPGFEAQTDGSVTQLLDAVLRGKVLAWVADEDDGSFGLEAVVDPAERGDARLRRIVDGPCRVVLAFEDGQAPVTVRLGADGEGGVYGIVEGKPEVFSAPESLRTLLSRIYVSRAVLRVPADSVESVKVTRRGGRAETEIAVTDPEALREAASGLFAEDVVSVGKPAAEPLDVEIVITLAEGGPPKRILCGPAAGGLRRCSTPSVPAVLSVKNVAVARFFAAKDAGRPED